MNINILLRFVVLLSLFANGVLTFLLVELIKDFKTLEQKFNALELEMMKSSQVQDATINSTINFEFIVNAVLVTIIVVSIFSFGFGNINNVSSTTSPTYPNFDKYPTTGDVLGLLANQTRGLEAASDIKNAKLMSLQREILQNQSEIIQTQNQQNIEFEKAYHSIDTLLNQLLEGFQ